MYNTNQTNIPIGNLLDTFLPTIFEPQPICFQRKHKKILGSISRVFHSGSTSVFTLKMFIIRNRFLYNCSEITEFEQIEHLIIGYGKKRGVGTDIEKIQHVIGEYNNVNIPLFILNNFQEWLSRDYKNEVVVFHNHPHSPLNAIYNKPLASGQDRDVVLSQKLNLVYLIRTFIGTGGGIRFFVGENGKVREIKYPRVQRIIEFLNAINSQNRQY